MAASAASSPARARSRTAGSRAVSRNADIRWLDAAGTKKVATCALTGAPFTADRSARCCLLRCRGQRAVRRWLIALEVRRFGEPLAVRVIREQQRAALQGVDDSARNLGPYGRAAPAAAQPAEPLGDGAAHVRRAVHDDRSRK